MRPLDRFAKTYSFIRPGLGTLVKGRWTEGEAQNAVDFTASIQPATGRDLQLLPEGDRIRAAIVIYTATELRTADPATKQKADLVAYKSQSYEVKNVQAWDETDLPHFKVLALQVEAD